MQTLTIPLRNRMDKKMSSSFELDPNAYLMNDNRSQSKICRPAKP